MTDPASGPLLCWMDIESTGLDPQAGQILEVAAVLTFGDLLPVAEYESLVKPITRDWESLLVPEVRAMHERSGLLAALADVPRPDRVIYPGRSVTGVGEELVAFVARYAPDPGSGTVFLAGSGVSHFDRRWIRRWWPDLDLWFHHATIDLGVVRRFLDVVVHPSWETRSAEPPHRALGDVHQILDEARRYRDMLSGVRRVGGFTPKG